MNEWQWPGRPNFRARDWALGLGLGLGLGRGLGFVSVCWPSVRFYYYVPSNYKSLAPDLQRCAQGRTGGKTGFTRRSVSASVQFNSIQFSPIQFSNSVSIMQAQRSQAGHQNSLGSSPPELKNSTGHRTQDTGIDT